MSPIPPNIDSVTSPDLAYPQSDPEKWSPFSDLSPDSSEFSPSCPEVVPKFGWATRGAWAGELRAFFGLLRWLLLLLYYMRRRLLGEAKADRLVVDDRRPMFGVSLSLLGHAAQVFVRTSHMLCRGLGRLLE